MGGLSPSNARDNSGMAPLLEVRVASSEPPRIDGSGNTIPDFLITEVDQAAGLVSCSYGPSGPGQGRGGPIR
ncbi:MAG: hypothetical protein HYY20_05990 [Candidatus Tectomicrobia bacterium]|uniref:Uncharacterized protein n=1 Tax=Tectimicrobiota bacterium TaxID=2528274 RepID=A0A932CN83_UNCTE|nr:hypothetical protein [Candidatus Tectomicrobia bacterium]